MRRWNAGVALVLTPRERVRTRAISRVAQVAVEDAIRLARIEGLEGHARAAEKRLPAEEPAAKKARSD